MWQYNRGNDMKNTGVYVGKIPKIQPENPFSIHRPQQEEPWLAWDINHRRMAVLTNNELLIDQEYVYNITVKNDQWLLSITLRTHIGWVLIPQGTAYS